MRIEFDQVIRRFGSLIALDEVSMELASGSRTALVGPNGSGKSTLIRVLMGLLRCQGTVRIDGRDAQTDRDTLAPRIAYMPQVAPRLQVTVGELVRAIARLRGIDSASIAAAAEALNLDLGAVRRKPIRSLSGGMRQKLLAAFALGSNAELLVLDEPTASMDTDSRERFFELVQQSDRRPTVILCSHRLEEIRGLVDDVAALEDGRLVRHGPVGDFLARHGRTAVELKTINGTSDRYLEGEGFRRGGTGWWRTTVASNERSDIVTRVTSKLGVSLTDIVVRELEHSSQDPR